MPPVSAQHYTTPARVWQLALNQVSLFGKDTNLISGSVAVPAKAAGTGTGIVDAEGNPHDTWTDVRARCVFAGSINRTNLVNPGQLPQWQLSYDGGATWSRSLTVSKDSDEAFIDDVDHGVRWKFSGAAPAFLVNDEWRTSTRPSPDIVAWIGVFSSRCNKYLQGSFKLPLTTWSEDLEEVVACLVRWALILKRGLAHDQNMKQYAPDAPMKDGVYSVMEWLKAAQRGEFQDDPDFSGAGTVRVYPDIVEPALSEPEYGTRTWLP